MTYKAPKHTKIYCWAFLTNVGQNIHSIYNWSQQIWIFIFSTKLSFSSVYIWNEIEKISNEFWLTMTSIHNLKAYAVVLTNTVCADHWIRSQNVTNYNLIVSSLLLYSSLVFTDGLSSLINSASNVNKWASPRDDVWRISTSSSEMFVSHSAMCNFTGPRDKCS